MALFIIIQAAIILIRFTLVPQDFFTVNHNINSVFKDDTAWKESDKIFKVLSKYNKLGIAKKRR